MVRAARAKRLFHDAVVSEREVLLDARLDLDAKILRHHLNQAERKGHGFAVWHALMEEFEEQIAKKNHRAFELVRRIRPFGEWNPLEAEYFTESLVVKRYADGFDHLPADGPWADATRSDRAVHAALWHDSGECMAKILGRGAEPNGGFGSRATFLQSAAMKLSVECVQALLDAGADPDAVTEGWPETPAELGARTTEVGVDHNWWDNAIQPEDREAEYRRRRERLREQLQGVRVKGERDRGPAR